MQKTKEELFTDCAEMKKKGFTTSTILNHLTKHCEDADTRKAILIALNDVEVLPEKKSQSIDDGSRGEFLLNVVMGIVLAIAGIILVIVLWNSGFVASLPIAMIIGGAVITFRALSKRHG